LKIPAEKQMKKKAEKGPRLDKKSSPTGNGNL
jgi:hypothetical protein